jgi:hypothetical protein
MNDDDPPLDSDPVHGPPPRDLPDLLLWLRDTAPGRYRASGRPWPGDQPGMTQQMLLKCLNRHGFKCNQARVSRMEHGESWPGMQNPDEKEVFLRAAAHCYALEHHPRLRAGLRAALLLHPGGLGFDGEVMKRAFEVLRELLEGQDP